MKVLVAMAFLLLGSSTALAQNFNFPAVAGTYYGEVMNGGDMDPLTTYFSVTEEGRLVGRYSIEDESGTSLGTLSSVIVEDPYTLTIEWTDKDGEGIMQIEFSNNFQQFDGFWGTRTSSDKFPLNGKK